MVLLRTSYMYRDFLEYYFRLQFSAFWSMHDKTSSWENANYKMYPPPPKKITELPPEKKLTPQPPPEKSRTSWQETQVTGNILIPWETLSFWKNISLPPPPAIKKKKISIYKKTKNITPCKSFNHPKIASTIMKKPQTPHLKNFHFFQNP